MSGLCPVCSADSLYYCEVADPQDCGLNGDRLVHHSSRGWSRDVDGWWSRPMQRRDEVTLLLSSDSHAFAMSDRLYCRNAKQKRRLDNGMPV